MPNAINFSMPPELRGDPAAQLGQMNKWLFQLTEQLNVALAMVNSGMGDGRYIAVPGGGSDDGTADVSEDLKAQINVQRDRLKALIISTADIVRFEFDEEIKRMESNYLAVSEFGEYKEQVSREISDTAQGTVEAYAAEIGLESYIEDSSILKEWQAETSGYIKRGFIYRNEEDVPILGIAIGQDIKTSAELVDGQQVIEVSNQNMGFFTSEGLEFYVNGQRVAFFRNDAAEMKNASISGRLRIGNWEFNPVGGLEISWIGGE